MEGALVVDDARRTKGRRGERSSPSLVSTSIGVVRSPPTQRMRGGDAEMWSGHGGRREGGVTLALAVLSLSHELGGTLGLCPGGLAVLPAALLGWRHPHLALKPKTLPPISSRGATPHLASRGSPELPLSQVDTHRHLPQGLSPGRAGSHGSRLQRRCNTMGNLASLTF